MREYFHQRAEPASYAWDTCLYGYSGGDYAAEGQYVDGLGKVYWEHTGFSSFGAYYGVRSETLVYYKKGNVEWGNPVEIDSLALNRADVRPVINWSVFPNPAEEKIVITHSNQSFPPGTWIEWTNAQGKVLATQEISGKNRIEWERGNWPAGLYLLRLMRPGEGIGVKKVLWK